MYFKSRVEAGAMLAEQLAPLYRFENCAVVALNDGGVMVGAQIAAKLHCVLTMLLSDEISLPLETMALAGISQDGTFSYNSHYSKGEIDEFVGEYRNYIEQEKLVKMHHMNELLGSGGLIRKELLRGHNVILVSDGIKNGFELDLAAAFLKPLRMEKLIIATPVASIQSVDRMHVLGDQIYCLNVIDSDMPITHYYDVQDIPDHVTIVKTIERIVLNWQ